MTKELIQGPGITLTPDPLLPQVKTEVNRAVVAFLADLSDDSGASRIGVGGGIRLDAKLAAMDVAIAGAGGGSGTPGAPAYLHTRYSNDGGLTFTASGGTVPGAYMGTYSDNTAAASTSVGAYTWVRVLGNTGPTGATGATGAAGATGPAGAQGIQGVAGANGQTSYFHTAYASSADGSSGFNFSSGAYIGTYVDFSPTSSGTYTVYTWRQFQGAQGPSGAQGIPGNNGANGQTQYLHLKWSNNGGTSFTASGGETPGPYLGTLVDFNSADSTTPGDYTWKLVEGAQGPQGVAGSAGATGAAAYLHVKWSNDGGATFTASGGETPGAYIGTCTDSNPSDPTVVGAYNWALIKGAQGDQGIQGPAGSNGLPSYTHVKWSNDNGATFTSSGGEDPGAYIGVYTDSTPTDSTSVSAYTWALVKGADGAPGAAGATGAAGASVYTATVYIQQVATPTAPSGGTMNFSTGTLTPPSGWTFGRPAFNPQAAIWSAQFTFTTSTPGATVTAGTYTTPIKVDNGAAASSVGGWYHLAIATSISPASAGCAVTLLSDGRIQKTIGVTNTIIGNWYLPTTTGIGASYGAVATLTGAALTGGSAATGSKVDLTSGAGWGINQSGGVGEKIASLDVKIVNNATGLIEGTGTINLRATADA